MWNKYITIYNAYIDVTGKTNYIRHNIGGCFVKNVETKTDNGLTQTKTKSCIIRIPRQKNYIRSDLWQQLTLKDKFITLQCDDIIVIGKVDDTIDDLVDGQRATDLIGKYKAVRIDSIVINNDLPKNHYKVTAI